MPNMAPLDDQVRQAVEKIVAEEHIDADVQMMTMTKAFYGGIPKSTIAPVLDNIKQTGKMIDMPAILVNGVLTATGIPDPAYLREALKKAAGEMI